MQYKKGYKYQLQKDEIFVLGEAFRFPNPRLSPLVTLMDGVLHVKKYYAWDGASGPTKDTKNSMRASLGHDALAQLMREGLISPSLWRAADSEFYKWLKEDGMSSFRLWFWIRGLKSVKGAYGLADNKKKVITAP